jgi:hypothetical protein
LEFLEKIKVKHFLKFIGYNSKSKEVNGKGLDFMIANGILILYVSIMATLN